MTLIPVKISTPNDDLNCVEWDVKPSSTNDVNIQDYVTHVGPGSPSYIIVPPFQSAERSDSLHGDPLVVVGSRDGVLRTNVYLRRGWAGTTFHFRVGVADDVTRRPPHVANITV